MLRWATAQYVRDIRPGEVVTDERVPAVLRTQRTPTFVTIDDWFWSRRHRDHRYCILYLALTAKEQGDIPALRRLLRLPEFRTRATRMGKVAWVSHDHVSWWQVGDGSEHTVQWSAGPYRRGHR
jgi:hypothetical protein